MKRYHPAFGAQGRHGKLTFHCVPVQVDISATFTPASEISMRRALLLVLLALATPCGGGSVAGGDAACGGKGAGAALSAAGGALPPIRRCLCSVPGSRGVPVLRGGRGSGEVRKSGTFALEDADVRRVETAGMRAVLNWCSSQFKNNHFTEMCCGTGRARI